MYDLRQDRLAAKNYSTDVSNSLSSKSAERGRQYDFEHLSKELERFDCTKPHYFSSSEA